MGSNVKFCLNCSSFVEITNVGTSNSAVIVRVGLLKVDMLINYFGFLYKNVLPVRVLVERKRNIIEK